jgi:hypothetical protein
MFAGSRLDSPVQSGAGLSLGNPRLPLGVELPELNPVFRGVLFSESLYLIELRSNRGPERADVGLPIMRRAVPIGVSVRAISKQIPECRSKRIHFGFAFAGEQ